MPSSLPRSWSGKGARNLNPTRDIHDEHWSKHSRIVPPLFALNLTAFPFEFNDMHSLANPCTPVRFRYSPPNKNKGLADNC